MIAELTNHLWQSTLFAVAAGLLTVAFRKNRAEVRYWLWFSASLKFFVPFALLINLGSHFSWAPATKAIAAPSITFAIEQVAEPFPDVSLPAASAPNRVDGTPVVTLILGSLWLLGFSTIVLVRMAGWRRIRNLLRTSAPIEISSREIPAGVRVRACSGLLEPGIVGWFRPILLLPSDIMERLTQPQMGAVLAHELCHVRRRDNLTSSIHMIVEAVFWFHPLVWWMSAQLVEERERACDEEVLRLGSEPQVYAEGILNVCKAYVESPLRCVSGVTGANLKKRIQSILSGNVAIEFNAGRKMALTVATAAALAIPVAVGMLNGFPARTQPTQNLSLPTNTPKWEVVSIKPCAPGVGGRGFGPQSPGRMHLACPAVIDLIHSAYFMYTDGRTNLVFRFPIDGGPAWINSSGYEINAKAEGNPSEEMMRGPMLQELLQSQFNLKIHRETREVPVYLLTVAKGGLKLPQFQEGKCRPIDLTSLPGRGDDLTGRCQWSGYRKPPNRIVDAQATTLDDFAKIFMGNLDRPVINNTGIKGRFDFNLEFAIDEVTAGDSPLPERSDEPAGPSIFTALEQVGLKLEATKGPWEFLVIDSIDRPKENEELSPAALSAKHAPSQPTGSPLTFEVASIKPTKDHSSTGGYCLGADESPVLHRGAVLGRCRFFNLTVRELINSAYPHAAGIDKSVVDGPSWTTTADLESSDRYTIEAKAENPSTVTHGQLIQMLQTLLADRFRLKLHTEVREASELVLVVAKGGPRLKEHLEGHPTGLQVDMVHQSVTGGTQISMLARFLSSRAGLDRAVTDRTGLTGMYDFTLTRGGGDSPSAPSLITALQEQLGLRVESQNIRIDAIVIDHVEKPTAN